ncbi:cytochrome b5-related protein-like [Anthonomus grandis grandis]|uniref:cytochrome b5-related protein-like n=1 Tax=Anthonomus grandis grandis TaxID=2921223 RepID=UPI002165116D|nr:cytochrome b5-related protein-like [Anthonomus grandis grandis]XP_050298516.1 cytochrome b5-related protein-like [Anthonomus grandis grandis]
MDMRKVFKSSLGIKYPTLRDHPLHSGPIWLEGRRLDDGAEGLWRIHDNLYDLDDFIINHPGGEDWIKLTKGTDITEAFESHHLSDRAENMLSSFFVKKASTPRIFPFTFHEKGFYKTLKGRIIETLDTVPKRPIERTKNLTDLLFVAYVTTFLLAVYYRSFIIGLIAGITLALLAVAAHNFFHQRDNFRRFYFDLCMMSSKEWRISHVLSHHMYTNTISDMEISSLEPFLQYLPGNKSTLIKYTSGIYSPIIFAFVFISHFLKTLITTVLLKKNLEIPWAALIPFTVPVFSWYVTGQPLWICAVMFLWVISISSLHFGIVGVSAAHHHPDIFHDGDKPRPKTEMDWGLHQVDAVMDRKDITGSHFLVLTNFGDHALHHLFPTIDHGVLEYLYPVFLKTCEEFGINWRLVTQLDLVKGQYRQLAKELPN